MEESLIGMRYGNLTVVDELERATKGPRRWLCHCDCGNYTEAISRSLTSGLKKSCGCLQKERASIAAKAIQVRRSEGHKQEYIFHSDYVEGKTSSGESFYIDVNDYDLVKEHSWCNDGRGYMVSRINGKKVYLHRLIMNCPKDLYVDHIQGPSTRNDNRKRNLRVVTNQQNSMNHTVGSANKSGYVGVSYEVRRNKWIARICHNGKTKFIGYYNTIDEAIEARKTKEIELFGEYRHK